MARSRLISGAKVVLYVNGRLFSRVNEFSFSSAVKRNEIPGIDTLQLSEIAPSALRCTGTIGVYKLEGDFGAEGAGMAVPFQELPREQYFSLTLVERNSGYVIFEARRCVINDQRWSFGTGSLAKGSISFSAIDWSNMVAPLPA